MPRLVASAISLNKIHAPTAPPLPTANAIAASMIMRRSARHHERGHARADDRALFVAELTGHFEALPLCIAGAAGAYTVSVLVMRRSILIAKIARRRRHIFQEYSVDALDLLQVGELMTADPDTLPGRMSVEPRSTFLKMRRGIVAIL